MAGAIVGLNNTLDLLLGKNWDRFWQNINKSGLIMGTLDTLAYTAPDPHAPIDPKMLGLGLGPAAPPPSSPMPPGPGDDRADKG